MSKESIKDTIDKLQQQINLLHEIFYVHEHGKTGKVVMPYTPKVSVNKESSENDKDASHEEKSKPNQ